MSFTLDWTVAKIGKWDKTWVVDPVRIAPWGTAMRPHLFEQEVTVTLSAPWQPNAEIRYTADGTEPGPRSITSSRSRTRRTAAW